MTLFPKPRLRTLLILSNVLLLVLPLAGIQLLRLYESALVRQTESALIAQGAFISAAYRSLLEESAPQTWPLASRELPDAIRADAASVWRPRPAELDLADSPVAPSFPDGQHGRAAEPLAAAVGERLTPILKDAQAVTLAGIRVTDPWGVVIASTGEDLGLAIDGGVEVQRALKGQAASSLRRRADRNLSQGLDSLSRTTGIRVFVATPIVLHQRSVGTVLLSRTPPNIVQALYAKRWLLAQAAVGALLMAVLLSLFASRLVTRPIAQLANRAERVAAGETGSIKPLLTARTHEVAKLQQSIVAMTERLGQRAAALEEFARHVSHEFKTPITSVRGAVEVLRDHGDDMTEAQRLKFLRNIEADNERLHRLTQRLLDLTRAEVADEQPGQSFELQPTLAALGEELGEGLQLRLQGDLAPLRVRGSAAAWSGVLETLADNARRHGARTLTVTVREAREQIYVDVSNDGEPISAGNRERIFEPFFTTRRESGGTGLGLTIARKLMEQMQGSLALLPGQPGSHCEPGVGFRLVLQRML
ncbi:MAG: HAMP domain-containing sensor histidine kinase [Pseudomonadota bacterium]